jgi:methyl-accepting chemotaxis protein
LPDDLKANITKLKNLSELMRKSNRLSSSHSASIAAIQDRAWEVREFGGRARTYYAITTLNGLPIPSADQTRVQLASKRAASAWGVLTNQLETFDAPADLTRRTSIAEQVYFEDYLATIDTLNASMRQPAQNASVAYQISFEQFFELSNGALRQMSDLSKNAGLELNIYWKDRSDAAWNSLILHTALVVFVVALVGATIWFIRSRVTSRLEAVTKDLGAVAEGKLETSIDNRSSDLAEVKDLIHSLHDLTNKLQQAEASNQERLLDQQMQGVVMETLSEGLQQLSNGNLGHQIAAAPADRYAALYDNFNKSCSKLRSLVGSVVQNSNDIDGQAGQVNGSVSDMARRTEQQATSFKKTVSALSDLSTSVTSTAEVSMQTDVRVTDTKERAKESGEVVDQAVAAMREIKASSDQVTQIIGLIDDIAFQTNLLALNAGVEAARSGEAGRGFAVVASEVRALAQRSAEAAKEISELISTSSKQVENGVSLVTNAGASLTDIVEMVGEISGLVSGISASSKEQATSLSDVSSAMVQLDQVTQQNNTMVHEVSNASEEMIRSPTELSQSTSQFSLGSQEPNAFGTEIELPKSA